MKYNRAMAQLSISLFGSFDIRQNGTALTGFRTDKARALFAYLAVEANRPHQRTKLAGMLWPDYPESRARTYLRHALSNLRQVLGAVTSQVLVTTRSTVQFIQTDVCHVDVGLFQSALNSLSDQRISELDSYNVARLSEAITLYRGSLLDGFHPKDCTGFEEWLLMTREHLHQQIFHILASLIEYYRLHEEDVIARRYAQRWVELEPESEQGHRQLMTLLARTGERSLALTQYETYCRWLRDDLNTEPEPETTELYESIRNKQLTNVQGRGAGVTNISQFVQLPLRDWHEAPEIDFFFGRTQELAELESWLQRERCRLVTLLGIGGVGKTALTVQLMHQVTDQFDAVVWRSLRSAPTWTDFIEDLIRTLTGDAKASTQHSAHQGLKQLLALLRDHRCLLVFDDLDTILQEGENTDRYRPSYEDYAEFFRQIGATSHQSCVLIASQVCPNGIELLIRDYTSVRLFQLGGLTPETGRQFLQVYDIAAHEDTARELVARYSGNPLALKLVSETIRDVFGGRLDLFVAQGTPIFGELREGLAQQFERLTWLERDALTWLALGRKAISTVTLCQCLIHPGSRADLIEALQSLRRRNLLEQIADHLHPPQIVTEYTTDRLIHEVCLHLQAEELGYFEQHSLIKSPEHSFATHNQLRLYLPALAEQLMATLEQAGFEELLTALLNSLRDEKIAIATGFMDALDSGHPLRMADFYADNADLIHVLPPQIDEATGKYVPPLRREDTPDGVRQYCRSVLQYPTDAYIQQIEVYENKARVDFESYSPWFEVLDLPLTRLASAVELTIEASKIIHSVYTYPQSTLNSLNEARKRQDLSQPDYPLGSAR